MRLSLSICFALFAVCIVARSVVPDHENARELYEDFKQKYGKNYANYDDHKRFAIFKDNLKRAQEYQDEEQGTAVYGVTQFSDLTSEEFITMYANANFQSNYTRASVNLNLADIPEKYDCREHGSVGPVLNQGSCGSCWAFSVVGNIEGQWFKKTGKLLSLSQQQLVDCDKEDAGCSGGWPPNTYKEVTRLGGLELASDYPYRGREMTCTMDKSKLVAHVKSSLVLPKDEAKQAAWLVQNGPIASALNADPLQFYRRGIIHPTKRRCSVSGMNHAVLTVGYGVEKKKKYWIVRNSWDTTFGEQGYFRIHRGDGTCGINEVCTSAIVE